MGVIDSVSIGGPYIWKWVRSVPVLHTRPPSAPYLGMHLPGTCCYIILAQTSTELRDTVPSSRVCLYLYIYLLHSFNHQTGEHEVRLVSRGLYILNFIWNHFVNNYQSSHLAGDEFFCIRHTNVTQKWNISFLWQDQGTKLLRSICMRWHSVLVTLLYITSQWVWVRIICQS